MMLQISFFMHHRKNEFNTDIQIHKSFQAMEKANFGALLTNLVDEIPLFVSESDEQDIEEKEGK